MKKSPFFILFIVSVALVFPDRNWYGIDLIVTCETKKDIGWPSLLLSAINFYVFFLASVNISSGILTTKNMNQSLDWTNYHLRCSWSTWSMRGKLLLSCGIVTMKRGILLAHKSVNLIFRPCFLKAAARNAAVVKFEFEFKCALSRPWILYGC